MYLKGSSMDSGEQQQCSLRSFLVSLNDLKVDSSKIHLAVSRIIRT